MNFAPRAVVVLPVALVLGCNAFAAGTLGMKELLSGGDPAPDFRLEDVMTGRDVRAALDAVLEDRPVSAAQKPAVGCSIKWKAGNAPDYFL